MYWFPQGKNESDAAGSLAKQAYTRGIVRDPQNAGRTVEEVAATIRANIASESSSYSFFEVMVVAPFTRPPKPTGLPLPGIMQFHSRIHVYYIKTNKFVINSRQPDSGLKHLECTGPRQVVGPTWQKGPISVCWLDCNHSLGLGHQRWEKEGGLHEGGLVLAKENVIWGCEAECRYVWLELCLGDARFDKFVQCVQCGMVSGVKESLG